MFGLIRGWQRRHWSERSKAERVELQSLLTWYVTTWVFFGSWMVLPLAGAVRHDVGALALGALLLLVGALQCVWANLLTLPALDHYLGRRPLPGRRLVVPTVLLGLAVTLVLLLRATGSAAPYACRLMLGGALLAYGLMYALVTPRRAFVVRGAELGGVCMAVSAVTGGDAADVLLIGLLAVFGVLFSLLAARCGAWTLSVLWEAERAREVEARLAVAEERLRFGRDLHDVLGRNLAVVALKSELAVQLARRGRPEAVEQMVEVQRIAQESQREVRDVVRGYREADLGAELAGAQGVLTAAGISCRVSGTAEALPGEVQSALGWVVREATTNVLRHGDARRCTVGLQVREGRAVLTVENDGAGLASGEGGGSGLAGLRERLAAVDGTLRAGPLDGGAFRLVADVPLARAGVVA
ncbi:sensor histidine kinase [Streptomyces actuosus]|uniref:Sensor histidine kinase n=1 Tax=Streptomyces actuosus TaxID=1885 RepID=A0ABS2VJB0_STRAS|nr:histidine kinase [Streptomyces actuosus]MBN0043155.1 sensor histidine kinase [Streptomyces actuosus]